MPSLFDIHAVDRSTYDQQIRDFLPPRIIDVHTHVWLDRFIGTDSGPKRAVTWPARVAKDNPIDDLIETYRLMFPDKTVTPVIFGNVLSRQTDIDASNEYVHESAKRHAFPALLFSDPFWSADDFEHRLIAGAFLGCKVYLTLSDPKLAEADITIFDFLPRHHLAVLNRHHSIAMLHIPRPMRLRDAKNLEQMLAIERDYPNVQLIIAHVGRAYCPHDIGNAFEILAPTKNMRFDISANTNVETFEQLLRAVGPKRVLFGSDLPITRMRMRRECSATTYVNIVPRDLYGDVSNDKNMREIDAPDADSLTFFLYEEILAFRRAAERVGLSSADIADVFFNNASQMIVHAQQHLPSS